MKLKQVFFLAVLTLSLTSGEFPILARFLTLPALAQEQNTVSPEQEGTIAPSDAIVQVDSKQAEAYKLFQQGLSHVGRGEFPEALESWQKALAIYKQIGNHLGEAASLGNLGTAYYHLGDYFKAIDYHQQSLAIKREISDRYGEANSLGNLGIAYINLGEYFKAIDYLQKSLAIFRKIGNREGEASSLGNLGLAYRNLGNYKKAIDYHQKSLAIFRKIGNRLGETRSLNNLGSVYYHLGDYFKAIDYFQNSLAITREIGYREGEAGSLGNLGLSYDRLEDCKKAKAIDYHQQSLAIAREIGNREGEAGSLGNLASVYDRLEDCKKAKAIDFHQKSLAIFREIGNRLGETRSLGNLGNAYLDQGDYKKAIDYFQNSLAITREIGYREGEAASLNNLGNAFLENNQLEQAQSHLFDAIKIWENIRHLLRNKDDWKISIFEEQARSYRTLQQVLVAQGKPIKALEISERGRNRALIDLLAAQLSETPQIKAPTLKEIQEIAKQQQATLVEYSIVDDQIYSWVIAPTGEITFRSNTLPQNTSLAALVTFSRLQIGVRGRANQNAPLPQNTSLNTKEINRLQELYQLLITPIVEVLPTNPSDRVIFIPHQELFMVPFAALQDDDGNYLIENHTILTAPSIQSLSFTRKNWHRVQDSTGQPLIVGNPTMPTLKIGREQEQLKPLPGAETEALTIAQLLKTKALIGAEATESTIVEKMANASVIHLATHGLLDDVNGIGYPGAIALAPEAPDHDGFLTSDEILIGYGLPEKSLLKAKLVVLSACDTGRGEIKGEGVVGLSRSLIAAGVPSLVVSLWQVPDHDTVKLMREFYTNIYTHKFDKAKAMREAMLSMLNDGDGNPDPKAWAAFTVIGETR
ncbi:tetratricopeptide repeat protein [Moorena producens]|uniref:CHAT domain-containing protein n=1 Tax=Moorena producens TaxID=1155739 RepID=UPI003C79639F